MAPLPLALTVASTVMSAYGEYQQGEAAEQQAKFEARQITRNSKATFAEGTRASAEYIRQGKISEGNMRAQMAGGGGVTSDASAVEMIAENATNANYNALSAMYSYKTKAQGQRFQARSRRLEGANAKKASRWKALSTVISGGGKAYGQYQDL